MAIKITVDGPKRPNETTPLWQATAEVIDFFDGSGHSEDHHAIRNLLISNVAINKKLMPGTMVALCCFEDITLFIGGKKFIYKNDDDDDDERKAYQSVLLLQTNPADWKNNNFPDYVVCIAGEIDLTAFKTKDETWKNLFPAEMAPENIVVHSSGFSFRGQARLPWSKTDKRIDSLIWASLSFPLPAGALATTLRLKPDFEAMNADRQKWQNRLVEYRSEFLKLSEIFSQELKFKENNDEKVWQRWLTLDLTNKTDIPEFHWEHNPLKPKEESLILKRGEVQMFLADQPPGERDVSARSLMTANIEAKFTTNDAKTEMTVSFDDGKIEFDFHIKKDEKLPTDTQLGVLKNKLSVDKKNIKIVWGVPERTLTAAESAKLSALSNDNTLAIGFRLAVTKLLNELINPGLFSYNLRYTPDAEPQENVSLTKLKAEYDAIDTATTLRRQHSLPLPDASVGVVEPALLCGYMPLADGWAQLPVMNLTEQIFFDALRPETDSTDESEKDAKSSLLLGAATFGNDAPEVFQASNGKTAWNITLLSGSRYEGKIIFTEHSDEWIFTNAELKIYQPDVSLNGFLWFGTAPPTAADALPNTDDWLKCFQPISLRTPKSDNLFPAPFVLNFDSVNFKNKFKQDETPQKEVRQYSLPTLSDWNFSYRANIEKTLTDPTKSVFEVLLFKGLWKTVKETAVNEIADLKKNFWRNLPLVWRKHPQMPLIQALPLTQNQMPPNYPSQSRQLIPFELMVEKEDDLSLPKNWQFEMKNDAEAARLHTASDFRIAKSWKDAACLWMASLGVPGLIFNPDETAELIKFETPEEASKRFPNLQYLYGLPYTDEINALAGLPKDEEKPRQGEEVSEPPTEPLTRENYTKYWQELSEKAILARQDADEVLAKSGTKTIVKNLAEPFVWQVNDAKLNVTAFPGSLVLNGTGGTMRMEGETALRGLEGKFNIAGNELVKSETGALQIEAGSMFALTDETQARDQRGLVRGVTDNQTDSFLKTELKHRDQTILLYSLKKSLELSVGDKKWRFWFRDLPVTAMSFMRLPSVDTDINDTAATSAERVHLTGYEWRLNDAPGIGEKTAIKLFGFDFFPMTLEEVVLKNDAITSIEFTGRLQLPETHAVEKPELGNVVRVVFAKSDTDPAFKLTGLKTAFPPDANAKRKGEWILKKDKTKDLENAPSLFWSNLELKDGNINLTGAELEFFLFNELWTIKDINLSFDTTTGKANFSKGFIEDLPAKLSVISLFFDNFAPQIINASLLFKWGGADDLTATAIIDLNLLENPVQKSATIVADLSNPKSGKTLKFDKNNLRFTLVDGAFQFSFDGLEEATDIQLFPGMHLSQKEKIKGLATMSFAIDAAQTAPGKRLKFSYGFCEAIIPCRWGEFLQDATVGADIDETSVFGSSAGIVYADYTLKSESETAWKSKFLLNGFVEVKNLISFPRPVDDFAGNLGDVRFESESGSKIIDEDKDVLKRVAEKLKENTNLKIRIEGHADIDGKYDYNLTLSKSRADSVKTELVKELKNLGLTDAQINARIKAVIGFSSGNPIDTNETFAGKQNNRRVEIVTDQVLIPAANPTAGPKPPLNHLRHTLRILLNQHELSDGLLTRASSQDLLLNFKKETAWQFLAAVEHQLADITQNESCQIKSERRWTVVQEIRFAHPERLSRKLEKFNNDINEILKTTHPVEDEATPQKLREVNFGYQRKQVLELLLKDGNQVTKLAETLIVEASAIHWILPREIAENGFTNLQYLPDLTQQALLSSPNDFAMAEIAALPKDNLEDGDKKTRNVRRQDLWLLLQMPFLGRMQDKKHDLKLPTGESILRADPIWQILELRQNNQPLNRLSLILSSLEDKIPFDIRISDFDYSRFRQWRRLDSATLEEAWFRLQNPPAEKKEKSLISVMASLPPDSPGRLSRSLSLINAFNEYRRALPPQALLETDPQLSEIDINVDLVWRRDNLFVLQGYAGDDDDGKNRDYGFHYVAAQIYSSKLFVGSIDSKKRFAAATMIPANLKVSDRENPIPVSFAVSPYLGLNNLLVKEAANEELFLVYVELIALEADGKSLSVIAGRIFQENFESEKWGKETIEQLANDSPIAILRERRIYKAADEISVRLEYNFIVLKHNPLKPLPTKKTRSLRVKVSELRFAEGQFGGFKLPENIRDFELAPPLVPVVKPLYFVSETHNFANFSAIRLKVQTAKDEKGLVGSLKSDAERRIWWNAASHHVQFAPPPEKSSLLPKNFRARSIHSLLPTVPNLPLPDDVKLDQEVGLQGNLKKWQPVLPGSYNYLIVGGRAGAQFTFRHSLLTQTKEKSVEGKEGKSESKTILASGGVPVQHRMPRPAAIPSSKKDDAARAMQTWASRFDFINKTLKVSANPADNAILLKAENDASGFSASLLAANLRLIMPNDDGKFTLKIKVHPKLENIEKWDLSFYLIAEGKKANLKEVIKKPEVFVEFLTDDVVLPATPDILTGKLVLDLKTSPQKSKITLNNCLFTTGELEALQTVSENTDLSESLRMAFKDLLQKCLESAPDFVLIYELSFEGETDDAKRRDKLADFLKGLPDGANISVEIKAEAKDTTIKGYKQTLVFPLRYSIEGLPPTALRPVFAQFEDPQYNRRLASQTAQSSRTYQVGSARQKTVALTLAADRREYNPTSELNFAVFGEEGLSEEFKITKGSLKVQRLNKESGITETLRKIDGFEVGKLTQINLSDFASPPLQKGEAVLLIFEAEIAEVKQQAITLRADIVNLPVMPMPEAAYALLRQKQSDGKVECLRFAWSPAAARVELTNPDDLKTGLVRRRAVFGWMDTIRFGSIHKYAVQKIMPLGSTHFPSFTEIE